MIVMLSTLAYCSLTAVVVKVSVMVEMLPCLVYHMNRFNHKVPCQAADVSYIIECLAVVQWDSIQHYTVVHKTGLMFRQRGKSIYTKTGSTSAGVETCG